VIVLALFLDLILTDEFEENALQANGVDREFREIILLRQDCEKLCKCRRMTLLAGRALQWNFPPSSYIVRLAGTGDPRHQLLSLEEFSACAAREMNLIEWIS
jgi:hypothetical protein